MKALVFEYFYLATALIIIAVGFSVTGNPVLIKFGQKINPSRILKFAILVSVVLAFIRDISIGLELNLNHLPWVGLSIIVGYVVTLSGAVGGVVLRRYIDELIFRHAAGFALILLGVRVAGVLIPSQLILLTFILGIVLSIKKSPKNRELS